MKRINEISAGGVVYKKFEIENSESEIKWLVGMHSGYHKWVLPKGRLENDETSQEAAVREVEEETGIKAKIINSEPIHVEKYKYKAQLQVTRNKKQETPLRQGFEGQARNENIPQRRVAVYQENTEFDQSSEDLVEVDKTVEFFLMEYLSGEVKDRDWEMTEAKWVNFNEALEMLSFEGEKTALKKANEIIQ